MGGYGKSVQHTPSKALESAGYKQALRELGLTEELISTALVEDIQANKGKRVPELRLGSDILGMTNDDDKEKSVPIININFIGFPNDKYSANSAPKRSVAKVVRSDD